MQPCYESRRVTEATRNRNTSWNLFLYTFVQGFVLFFFNTPNQRYILSCHIIITYIYCIILLDTWELTDMHVVSCLPAVCSWDERGEF